MVGSRWQIAVGAAVLLLMLLCGAFSIGVYVGEHGWTKAGLQYQPAAPQPGSPGPPPDLVGRIKTISPQGIQVATKAGPRYIELQPETRAMDENGNPIEITDLKNGDIVALFGTSVAGDGGRFVAARIIRLAMTPP